MAITVYYVFYYLKAYLKTITHNKLWALYMSASTAKLQNMLQWDSLLPR